MQLTCQPAYHQGYAGHDRASPCQKISLTIPPCRLPLKYFISALLTLWTTDTGQGTYEGESSCDRMTLMMVLV